MNLQPTLSGKLIELRPLKEEDWDELYLAASDPLIWEQHPNPNRFQSDVFRVFFEGAIQSKGAFAILDISTQKIIGSSRFYDHDIILKNLFIGYTFLVREAWGKGFNKELKELMLNYAFQYVEKIYFHIGACNIRSQRAIEKIGATQIGQIEKEYYGESSALNFIYRIEQENWHPFI